MTMHMKALRGTRGQDRSRQSSAFPDISVQKHTQPPIKLLLQKNRNERSTPPPV